MLHVAQVAVRTFFVFERTDSSAGYRPGVLYSSSAGIAGGGVFHWRGAAGTLPYAFFLATAPP